MNLRTSFPSVPDIDEDSFCFALGSDLSRQTGGRRGVDFGHMLVDHERIYIYERDKLINTYRILDFAGIEVERMVGCSLIRGRTRDGVWICFAAFSQTHFLRFAEVAKILDFYINTGTFTEESTSVDPVCPKCGMTLGENTVCVHCIDKGGVFKKLFLRIMPYKGLFLMTLISSVMLYAAQLISPFLERELVDKVIVPMNADWNLILMICGGMMGIGVFEMANFYVLYIAGAKLSGRFGRDLRRDVFSKTQEMSMKSVHKRTAGELISRIAGDTGVLQEFVTGNGRDMILQSMALIAISVVMFAVNWQLALLVVIPFPLVFWVNMKARAFMHLRFMQVWRYHTDASDRLHDIVHGIRVVKNYGSEKREADSYEKASLAWAKVAVNVEVFWALVVSPARYLLSLGEFAMLYAGGSMVLGLEIDFTLGQLVQFTSYVYSLYGPVEWLMHLPRALAQTGVSAAKVFELLDEDPDLADMTEPVTMNIRGELTFENVYFGYKTYNPVLKDVSCDIKQGEMVGIVGHSGAGKSTFINLIMRLYDVTSGSVKIDGVDVRHIAQSSLRSQVGVVLQDNFLFNGSVLDNIRYAKPDADFLDVVAAAKVGGCHDFIAQLPDGYNTIVGERGYNLSGGERQRVAIARAILHDPKIIILDEATASLDAGTEKEIQDALGKLTSGRTTIAIAHRLSTLSRANRLIVFDKGKVVETGTHGELMRLGGVYFELVMAQRQTAKIKN